MYQTLKNDMTRSTKIVRSATATPLRITGAIAGGATGLGVGIPVGIAALFFGKGNRRGSNSLGILNVPSSIAIPVLATAGGGMGGSYLGDKLSKGISLFVGGIGGIATTMVLAIPRGIRALSSHSERDLEAGDQRYIDHAPQVSVPQSSYSYQNNFAQAWAPPALNIPVQIASAPPALDIPAQIASAPPALTPLQSFLREREQFPNRQRVYQALFDLNSIAEDDPRFQRAQEPIYAFFEEKVGKNFEEYKDLIMCPIELDIMNDPVCVPNGVNTHVFGYESLIDASGPIWKQGQYQNALTRQIGDQNQIQPAYFTQSLIERIIIRCYEFRALMEKDLANAPEKALKRYKNFSDNHPTNQERLTALLGDKASMKAFLIFLNNHPTFGSTFGEQANLVSAMFQALSQSDKLPKMPVIYRGMITDYDPKTMNPSEVAISYDTQNVIEQILFMARNLGPEFSNRNRFCL